MVAYASEEDVKAALRAIGHASWPTTCRRSTNCSARQAT